MASTSEQIKFLKSLPNPPNLEGKSAAYIDGFYRGFRGETETPPAAIAHEDTGEEETPPLQKINRDRPLPSNFRTDSPPAKRSNRDRPLPGLS